MNHTTSGEAAPTAAGTQEPPFEYDVALSYASEDREYVDRVAKLLEREGLRVFYDRFAAADLWGKDLYVHLDDVYSRQARYCIIFASQFYGTKVWTTHELQGAQARALLQNREYILPARFDDTPVPGVRDTTAYVDLRERSPEQLAKLVIGKLRGQPAPVDDPPKAAKPLGRWTLTAWVALSLASALPLSVVLARHGGNPRHLVALIAGHPHIFAFTFITPFACFALRQTVQQASLRPCTLRKLLAVAVVLAITSSVGPFWKDTVEGLFELPHTDIARAIETERAIMAGSAEAANAGWLAQALRVAQPDTTTRFAMLGANLSGTGLAWMTILLVFVVMSRGKQWRGPQESAGLARLISAFTAWFPLVALSDGLSQRVLGGDWDPQITSGGVFVAAIALVACSVALATHARGAVIELLPAALHLALAAAIAVGGYGDGLYRYAGPAISFHQAALLVILFLGWNWFLLVGKVRP
ncbi:MAG: TIR domain-containing protein [bacterium]|nr:TIR domain-containing protein [bacterium]